MSNGRLVDPVEIERIRQDLLSGVQAMIEGAGLDPVQFIPPLMHQFSLWAESIAYERATLDDVLVDIAFRVNGWIEARLYSVGGETETVEALTQERLWPEQVAQEPPVSSGGNWYVFSLYLPNTVVRYELGLPSTGTADVQTDDPQPIIDALAKKCIASIVYGPYKSREEIGAVVVPVVWPPRYVAMGSTSFQYVYGPSGVPMSTYMKFDDAPFGPDTCDPRPGPSPAPAAGIQPEPLPEGLPQLEPPFLPPPAEPLQEPELVPVPWEPEPEVECCPPVDIFEPGAMAELPLSRQRTIYGWYGVEHLTGLTMAEISMLPGQPGNGGAVELPYPIEGT